MEKQFTLEDIKAAFKAGENRGWYTTLPKQYPFNTPLNEEKYIKSLSRKQKRLKPNNELLDCPYDFTSRCTMGRCDCKPKLK